MCLVLTPAAISCQVYPSEYAYKHDSVNRTGSDRVNCNRYNDGIKLGANTNEYIHCDGNQLQLTDSNFGREQYQDTDYYWWSTGRTSSLLFTFPTSVSLTTITMHYYSDSVRGLARLRFYVVPDDFDIWSALTTSYSHVDVAAVSPGEEPAGRRNITINVTDFKTKKTLMHIIESSSTFLFAVSEVEFFTCNGDWLPNNNYVVHYLLTSIQSIADYITTGTEVTSIAPIAETMNGNPSKLNNMKNNLP